MSKLFLKRISRDVLGMKSNREPKSLDTHIKAAFEWLCAAQDATSDGGVSLRYSMLKGWDASYPETTGYIIPNFIDYAGAAKDDSYMERALRMADWELSIQKPDGSFNGGALGSGYDSFVFDTGQILFGLIAAHRATGEKKYLDGALRAGDWLCAVQEPEGMWKKFTFNKMPHVYYARVAMAVAELAVHNGGERYKSAACANIDWVLANQRENGWFDLAGFTEQAHEAPYTHTIAYTMEGVLETGAAFDRVEYIDAIVRSADSLCEVIGADGFCHGRYDKNWRSEAKFSCLTGSAQIALVLLRLYERFGTTRYLEVARAINGYLCRTQDVGAPSLIRGAIGGSYPAWGDYQRVAFPNWAAKFFIDSLTLEKKLMGA